MERELVQLFEAAKKAADSAAALDDAPADERRCLDALKTLKTFPVNYQLLCSTQVGKRLRQLTKHPKRKIQGLASDLLKLWKSIVIEETASHKNNGSLGTASLVKVEATHVSADGADKMKKVASAKIVKKASVSQNVKIETFMAEKKVEDVSIIEIEKTDVAKKDEIEKLTEEKPESDLKKPSPKAAVSPKLTSMIKCNDSFRDKIREIILEALSKVSGEADGNISDELNACDPIQVAVSVECALFEKFGRSNGAQKNKYRSILFNMKDPKNPDFRRKVLCGLINPEKIPNLTAEDMASEQRQLENERIKEKAMNECERGGEAEATTDQFPCSRCGQRKTTYYQMQTRSADEPMTTFVTCVNCGNRWKFC